MKIKRRIRPQTLALTGLFCGLLVGVSMLITKQWLINQIVRALEDEVTASCDCSLAFDSFSLSFFTLSAKARNIRIIENGKPRLSFKTITTNVDLSEIKSRRVHLENLTLSGGIADGVGPNSVTFNFIDQLTKPLPPEKQRPNRWRVILDSLFIKKSFLREPFGESELSGSGVMMKLHRQNDAFILEPFISDFRYTTYAPDRLSAAEELHLGDLKATLQIKNSITTFKSVSLGRAYSSIKASAQADGRKDHLLEGSTDIKIQTQYIGLPEWLEGFLIGKGALKGSLGSPLVEGMLSTDSADPLTLSLPHAEPVAFPELSGKLSVDVNHGDPLITISNIRAEAPLKHLVSRKPLLFSKRGLQAAFEVTLPEFSYGPFKLRTMKAVIETTPATEETRTLINIKTEGTELQGVALGPSKIEIVLTKSAANIKAIIANKQQGKLDWRGTIDLSASEPYLSKGSLSLDSYRYLTSAEEKTPSLWALTASKISVNGPLDMRSLNGDGPLAIHFPNTTSPVTLAGSARLEDGVLAIDVSNAKPTIRASAALHFNAGQKSTLNIAIPATAPHNLFGHKNICGRLGGALNYAFKLDEPLLGNGTITMNSFSLGCEPHSLTLTQPSTLPIANGDVTLESLSLTGRDSSLGVRGKFGIQSGFNLFLTGNLDLESMSHLIPNLDNLQGEVKIEASAQGPVGKPILSGTAQLSRARFGFSSPDIEAHNVTGNFTFQNDSILVDDLQGSINGGTFSADGTTYPFDWNRSTLHTSLQEVSIEPEDDTSITFSGDLRLESSTQQKQTLSGELEVLFAEVSKEFDINKIVLKTLSGYFLPSRVRASDSSNTLDIGLDVSINSARNIFIITPFLNAELNATLRASGTTSSPTLDGTMQFLSGWIGVKGNRFDINSGKLLFSPGSLVPQISLASEGTLRASTGESITVILEVVGQLPSPKITLSSDRGLSQNELLYLLTSSRPIGESSLRARMTSDYGASQTYSEQRSILARLRSFFRSLTRLDVLSFEPAYNQFSGAIEPAIIARKNISPRFNLVGESLFSSVSNSRAGGVFALTPSIDINAFIQTVSTQKNSIVSSDMTFTVLSKQAEFVTLNVSGNKVFHDSELLLAARLTGSSRIQNSPSTLSLIEKQIVSFMQDMGHRQSTSSVQCIRGNTYCEELGITVTEGPSSTILGIAFDGDSLPESLVDAIKKFASIGKQATKQVLQDIERKVIVTLRNEGYIASRATATYIDQPSGNSCIVRINTDLQQPISFIFQGNTVFSAEDFLTSINLFSRKRAFGNNTINVLVQNIEQMYLTRGHLFVQVRHSATRDSSGRIIYQVTIEEDSPITVKALKFTGNESLDRAKIKQRMRALGFDEYTTLLSPQFAIPSQLDSLKDVLLQIYENEGFPSADISYQIRPAISANNLDIEFTISEGPRIQVDVIQVVGTPSGLTLPSPPETPTPLTKINEYIQNLQSALINAGYLMPIFTTDIDQETKNLLITIVPGIQTFVAHITYEGISLVDLKTVQDSVALAEGTPLLQKDIDQTKRDLLRTGLFSRIEVLPSDGNFNDAQENIIIRVTEKPLQTLEVGIGGNSEFGLHTFGEASDKSLFADGRTLTLRADTYFDQSRINPSGSGLISQGFTSIRFVDPTIGASKYTLTEELRYQRQELSTQEFNLDRLLLGSYIFRRFDSSITLSAGHSLLLDNPQDVSPDAVISELDDETIRLSFVSGVLKLDERNDPLLPSRGYTFTLEPKLASRVMGSEASFLSLLARSSVIVPLSNRYSLGVRLNGGIAQAIGSTDEIPITQRFYLGGRTSVRGFRENSLGPRGANGSVIGGNALVASKLEIQHRTLDSLSTHIFFDAGNVFLRGYDANSYSLRTSIGAGFQYLSPIGPIGFDIGHPLDERSGEPSVRVHFSVGSMF